MSTRSLENVPDLAVVPAQEMLGHVRPRGQFEVRAIRSEQVPGGMLEEFHISGQKVGGAELLVSLRLLTTDPGDRRVVFSLPGGAGAFPDGDAALAREDVRRQSCGRSIGWGAGARRRTTPWRAGTIRSGWRATATATPICSTTWRRSGRRMTGCMRASSAPTR